MHRGISKKIAIPFELAVTVLVVLGITSYHRSSNYQGTYAEVGRTYTLLAELDRSRDIAAAADSGLRAYIITGDSAHLKPYETARELLKQSLGSLKDLSSTDPVQLQEIFALDSSANGLLDGLDQAVSKRQHGDPKRAAWILLSGQASARMDDFRSTADHMEARQQVLLDQESRAAERMARFESTLFTALALIAMLLLGTVGALAADDFNRRKESEDTLNRTNAELNTWVNELERRTTEMSLIAEMGEQLQMCRGSEEAYDVVRRACPRLFPALTGAVYILNSPANLLQPVVAWGQDEEPDIAQPEDCWAFRSSRIHVIDDAGSSLSCGHLPIGFYGRGLCIPMLAHGKALGVFHLREKAAGEVAEAVGQLAKTVAEHVALAFANLRLREMLRSQSIRDSLTGMFNRRYMEESLEREIRRAERSHRNVGIVMLDIDHFKGFNDTCGHDAGDALLSALGEFLRNNVRAEDIACRYGGEEFALILPDATSEMTHKRAEQILQGARCLEVAFDGAPLGPITLSLGVATYPENGPSGDLVMRAADTALYEAKKSGRNRVMLALTQSALAGGTAGDEQQTDNSLQSSATDVGFRELNIPVN